ncbi:MAG: 16S rRNA (adenine(1518)-N(6)/adenine(1519)-N(6))-dimethyltransferase RsmA [Planctomycetota bacterium]|jgi:16S rRNA (adenine1518-N6/adenine1519-N6)-dimethyltransferase|nr:16S rRNA (adenine(1518)-N(6)/adenine(1519)-N(6))-dimethyltransferase RsmA [Planctomycetota bacterium]
MPDGPAAVPPRQTTAYLKELFGQVGFTIDARRGQNFLVDLNLLDLITRAAEIGPRDVVLEVGTGTGSLTERLAAAAGRVVTAEIDPRLAQLARDRLVERDNVMIVEGDVLARKHRFAPAFLDAVAEATAALTGGRLLLVANLPYCVATPVISNLLALPRPFDAAIITVQREMAERMTAAPGTSSYNALSVWVGAQCRGEILRVLSPTVFWPRPAVDSAIVRLDLEPERRARISDLTRFHHFVRDVFCHRRKLLRGVLVRMAGGKADPEARHRADKALAAIQAGPEARAEEIPPAGFVILEEAFYAAAPSG